MLRTTFTKLCKSGAKSGYALERGIVIKHEHISKAELLTANNIDELMRELERSSGRCVKHFYIGKTHVRERKGLRFNPENSHTWRLDNGVNARYATHVKEGFGKDGLIVVAVVTKESIPNDCMTLKCITHQEEYALILEKRLIQKYKYAQKDKRLANNSTKPGKTDGRESRGYTIYISFALQGKSAGEDGIHTEVSQDDSEMVMTDNEDGSNSNSLGNHRDIAVTLSNSERSVMTVSSYEGNKMMAAEEYHDKSERSGRDISIATSEDSSYDNRYREGSEYGSYDMDTSEGSEGRDEVMATRELREWL